MRLSGALWADILPCFEVSLSPLGLAFFAAAWLLLDLFGRFGMRQHTSGAGVYRAIFKANSFILIQKLQRRVLKVIWMGCEQPCGKRLKAAVYKFEDSAILLVFKSNFGGRLTIVNQKSLMHLTTFTNSSISNGFLI
jgi:hypothetical protein